MTMTNLRFMVRNIQARYDVTRHRLTKADHFCDETFRESGKDENQPDFVVQTHFQRFS